jgi:hypothetical protein
MSSFLEGRGEALGDRLVVAAAFEPIETAVPRSRACGAKANETY